MLHAHHSHVTICYLIICGLMCMDRMAVCYILAVCYIYHSCISRAQQRVQKFRLLQLPFIVSFSEAINKHCILGLQMSECGCVARVAWCLQVCVCVCVCVCVPGTIDHTVCSFIADLYLFLKHLSHMTLHGSSIFPLYYEIFSIENVFS